MSQELTKVNSKDYQVVQQMATTLSKLKKEIEDIRA
jgi:hypothetical protein